MRFEVFRNDAVVGTIDFPDDYYKILRSWNKRKAGSWFQPMTSQDKEAMDYLKSILLCDWYSQKEIDIILSNLNLTYDNIPNYNDLLIEKKTKKIRSSFIPIYKVETVLRNLGYKEEEIENVINCIGEEL